jgi:hypothetical protein
MVDTAGIQSSILVKDLGDVLSGFMAHLSKSWGIYWIRFEDVDCGVCLHGWILVPVLIGLFVLLRWYFTYGSSLRHNKSCYFSIFYLMIRSKERIGNVLFGSRLRWLGTIEEGRN